MESYDNLVAMMRDGKEGVKLPALSTLRLFTFPRVIKNLFVKSSNVGCPMKKGYCTSANNSARSKKVQTKAVVILPTA